MEDEENPHSRRGTVEVEVVNAVLSAEERYGEIPGGVRRVQGAESVSPSGTSFMGGVLGLVSASRVKIMSKFSNRR